MVHAGPSGKRGKNGTDTGPEEQRWIGTGTAQGGAEEDGAASGTAAGDQCSVKVGIPLRNIFL